MGEIFSKAKSDHLLNALKYSFTVSNNWEGGNYPDLNIYWDYKKTDKVIYIYQIISQNPLIVCNIKNQRNPNMHRTSGIHQIIYNTPKWRQIQIQVLLLEIRRKILSNQLLGHLYIMQIILTQLCFVPSMKYPKCNINLHKTPF